MPHTIQGKPTAMKPIVKLKMMQVNVGRGGPATEITLTLAFENNIDIVVMQEPWIGADLERKLSKKHNAYQAFAPLEVWNDRPRVLTYVRWNSRLQIAKRQDLITTSTPNCLILEIKAGNLSQPSYIVSVYNAPPGCTCTCTRAGEATRNIMQANRLMELRTVMLGDMNLHHVDWDMRTQNPSAQAMEFANWIAENGASYNLPPGTVSQTRGGCIDLVITSRLMTNSVIESFMDEELDGNQRPQSDHFHNTT